MHAQLRGHSCDRLRALTGRNRALLDPSTAVHGHQGLLIPGMPIDKEPCVMGVPDDVDAARFLSALLGFKDLPGKPQKVDVVLEVVRLPLTMRKD